MRLGVCQSLESASMGSGLKTSSIAPAISFYLVFHITHHNLILIDDQY